MLKKRKLGVRRVLIVGCGDVGMRMIPLLVRSHRILALTSSPDRAPQLRAAGAVPLHGNLDERCSLARLRGLATHIIHLAPPAAIGSDDPRTARLLRVLAQPSRHAGSVARQQRVRGRIVPQRPVSSLRLVYGSTTGVYGDCGGALIDETRKPQPRNARAVRRVAAERHVRAWGRATTGRSASILRIPGIYAADRLPLARLQKRTPALCAADDVHTNHIHADDLARIAVAALFRGAPQRVYHASDDTRWKMGEYFDRVADWAGLPHPPRISAAEARQQIPETMLSFMRESRRLDNRRMKSELRVTLRHPTVADFLAGTSPP